MLIYIVTIATFFSTLLGGLLALRLQDRLHIILGFSAGAVMGVAFFDLVPEALDLAGTHFSSSVIVGVIAVGFFLYLALDRLLILHGHGHEEGNEHHSSRGSVRAGSLSVHSFLDGAGIGLAFQVSPAVGLIVAIAVLAHDFSDGINTVSVIVRHGGKRRDAMRWLLVDALAPVLGILSTLFFSVPSHILGLLLALFAGFFIYIGASDLIPESHHSHPTFLTTAMTLLGALVLFGAIQLAGL